ncbi:MAG: DUF6483 family protein [Agathobacter sp.]
MEYENDFIMRQVRDMVRMLAKVLFGKNTATYEYHEDFLNETSLDDQESNRLLNDENRKKVLLSDRLYFQLITMVNAGKINEAENLLSDKLDEDENGFFEAAPGFYEYLNTLSDDFLEKHDYSREEVKDGAQNLADRKGLGGLGA